MNTGNKSTDKNVWANSRTTIIRHFLLILD